MVKIIWSPRAIKDINEIAEYIAKDSLQYAEEQVKSFFSKAIILEDHPHIGRIVPELKISSIRQILCDRYRIIYEVLDKERIAIITIHHQARLLKNSLAFKRLRKKK
jgi:toxin ParE1/3/4